MCDLGWQGSKYDDRDSDRWGRDDNRWDRRDDYHRDEYSSRWGDRYGTYTSNFALIYKYPNIVYVNLTKFIQTAIQKVHEAEIIHVTTITIVGTLEEILGTHIPGTAGT